MQRKYLDAAINLLLGSLFNEEGKWPRHQCFTTVNGPNLETPVYL